MQAPVRQGAHKRAPNPQELMALLVAALGAISQRTGVLWQNARDANGEPIAIAVVRRAHFQEDAGGQTTLTAAETPTQELV